MKSKTSKFSLCALFFAASAALSACGGGSVEASPDIRTASVSSGSVQASSRFAAYHGTWVAPCDGDHTVESVTIASVDDVMTAVEKSEFYDDPECKGSPVAVSTSSLPMTATLAGAVRANVILPPATVTSAITFDKLHAKFPALTETITGKGVYSSIEASAPPACLRFPDGEYKCFESASESIPGGVPSTCVRFTNGDHQCVVSGVQPKLEFSGMGFYVDGTNLHMLIEIEGAWTSVQVLAKQ
jgi:hypothetical protein